MRYFFSKQIHSCFASCSSSDVILRKEVKEKAFNEKFKNLLDRKTYGRQPSDIWITSKKYGFSILYVEEDKTFYERGLHQRGMPCFEKTPEFKDLVASYEKDGWVKDSWVNDRVHAYHDDIHKMTVAKRIRDGYVIPEWKDDLPIATYQGGFSNKVFNGNQLHEYLESGGVHGYIGHSIRKPGLDRYLEKAFTGYRRGKSVCMGLGVEMGDVLGCWLTSTDGRHFGDSLEGCSFNSQKSKIKKNVECMFLKSTQYLCNDEKFLWTHKEGLPVLIGLSPEIDERISKFLKGESLLEGYEKFK